MGFEKTSEATIPETPTKVSRENSVTLYEDDLKSWINTLAFFGYRWQDKGQRKSHVRSLNSLNKLAEDLEPYFNLTYKSVGKEFEIRAIKTHVLANLEKEVEDLRKKVIDLEKKLKKGQ
jgi:hypothetical protein